jgi:hypothetical protein
MRDLIDTLHHRVASHRDAIVSFRCDLIRIPSFDSNIREVAACVELL